jgi:hypothetical protein
MIVFAPIPIPIITKNGEEGYIMYVNDGGQWENDIFCVVLCEGGVIRHYTSSQITVHKNATFEIKEKQ